MAHLLAEGDPDSDVGAAWVAKELRRDVYAAVDEAHARRRLILFFEHCADADVAEVSRLARTVDRWSNENHTNYRRRILGRLGTTWPTLPARRLRGHQPRLIS